MTTVAERFAGVFRAEHREVRDALLELIDAFETRDRNRIALLLERIATVTGPHFRYEEESLYPALVPIFGADYVATLVGDHDGAIDGARRLVAIAAQETLTDADVVEAVFVARSILPHVSDCDGLSIMVELLPDEKTEQIFAARERALDAGLDLLTWARNVRGQGGDRLEPVTAVRPQ